MCDYCSCREHDPIADLSADHERLLNLSARVRTALRAGDETTAGRYLADVVALLEPHAAREERGLFAALAADDVLRAALPALLVEHDGLRAGPGNSPAEVGAFLDALAEHIDREEHDIFPAASQLLDPAGWDIVLLAHAGARPEGGGGPTDGQDVRAPDRDVRP